jgi:hypothetical protein
MDTGKHGPGISWLAARTGKDPDELTSSPAATMAALKAALREAAALAARVDSADSQVQADAQAELGALRERFASAPRSQDRFMTQVAAALRHTAERLRYDRL